MPNDINHVVVGNETKLDLRGDTVTPSTMLSGIVAHDASGARIVGTFDPSIFVQKSGDTMTGALECPRVYENHDAGEYSAEYDLSSLNGLGLRMYADSQSTYGAFCHQTRLSSQQILISDGDGTNEYPITNSVTLGYNGIYFENNNAITRLDDSNLTIADKDILRTHQSLVGGWGTNIALNTNLNTDLALWRVGRFYVAATDSVATLTNCPTTQAFNMTNENVQGVALDGQIYQYMRRTIKDLVGDTFVQTGFWSSSSTIANISEWKKVLTDTPSTYARTNITSASDANLSLTVNFGGNWYRKSGNVIEINLSVSGAVDGWRTVTTLPEAYRPPVDRYFSALTLAYGVGAIYVSSAGLVRVRTASGTGTVGGCVTYIV